MVSLFAMLTFISAEPPAPGFAETAGKMAGLIGYWRMDGDLNDSKGSMNGVANGAVTFAEGVVGRAAVFGGGFATVEQSAPLDVDQTTVAFFFRVDAFPAEDYNPCMVAKRKSSPDTRFSIHVMKGSGGVALWNGQGLVTADPPLGPIQPGEWHHFCATADTSMTRIYIDGVQCASIGGLPRREAKNLPLMIGASSPAGEEKFTGAIDELIIFDRPLPAEEVAGLVDAVGWKERRVAVVEALEQRLEEKQKKIDERRKEDAAKVVERLNDLALTARGETRVYEGDHLAAISLPVGGIGTGVIHYNGNAEPHVWQIFNNYNWVRVPESYMAVRAQVKGQEPVVRALQTAAVGKFSSMETLQFRGEYPFGWFDFIDSQLPVKVSLEVFNPLVPLDARDSAIPCVISNVTVTNTGNEPVEVDLLAAQLNAVGFAGKKEIDGRAHAGFGKNVNRIVKIKNGQALHMTADRPKETAGNGDMALAVLNGKATGSADWPQPDAAYDVFLKDGASGGPRTAGPSKDGETVAGAVVSSLTVAPGKSERVTFVLGWHFPNVTHGNIKEKWNPTGNMYANWYEDACAVVRDVSKRLAELTDETRAYHDTMYASNLPRYLLDRVTSQMAVLRSPTCFWAKDGYFGGWEGCNPAEGCCHGNCGHVWQYAQSHARLFPEIGRLMREEALSVQEPDGALPFRQPKSIKAVDAQCGEILAVYREYLLSADGEWLKPQWPRVKKAMEFTITQWDADENGALSGVQHNTLDVNVSGSTSWLGTMYVAALRASAVMAGLQGDAEAQGRFSRVADAGAKIQNETLYNGEYYIQIQDASPQHDYANGCSIDQVLGQWWANQLDLGWIYPVDRVQSAMRALIHYNFHDNYRGIVQAPRKFVHDDDAGLQMIQWPRESDRPQPFTLYADEVWTGTEYSAAAAMMQAGLMNEGLMIVKAAYDRYDGRMRIGLTGGSYTSWGYSGSPFIDEECGKFYARAMSVWSLLLAAQGSSYDGPAGRIGFAPVWRPDDHVSMFTAAEGYGLFTQKQDPSGQTDRIEMRGGQLKVAQLAFETPVGKAPTGVTVTRNGSGKKLATAAPAAGPSKLAVKLEEPVVLKKGDVLEVTVKF
ncbi:MAG TPA: GH116 family glycosyl-hydrolase [Candidatus Bathyarchaeia archaeon]|nr:GH116 family glycosyl-hydrolase [Candidatus Bathyarchaeia archaeon]